MSKETAIVKMKDQNYIKMAQFYNIFQYDHCDNYSKLWNYKTEIEAIINDDFDINYKVPSNCLMCKDKPQYSGNTISHYVIEFYVGKDFDIFIKHGNLAVQNDNGYTPLLLAFIKGKGIDNILCQHLTIKNFNNFHCKNNLSHFHVACSTNITEIIDCYLKTGVSVNERVNNDSPHFPGYTPLHFAMQYCQPQTILLLLNNGANLQIKDSKMMTPFHVLIQSLVQKTALDNEMQKFLQDAISTNLFDLPDDTGLNYTHLSCISGSLKDISEIDTLVNFNSLICAGYTPLHFAAHFHFETVILLLKAGANLLAKDAKGSTPFDLCLKKFNLNEIIQILLEEKQHQLSLKLKFTNGISVINTLIAMEKYKGFSQFVQKNFRNKNTCIHSESSIWPGCSLLHLAVMFNGPVPMILANGASPSIQDANGMSPLHIAWYWKKEDGIVYKILDKKIENSVDKNNFSHLHIVCAISDRSNDPPLIKHLLNMGANPNLSTLCDIQYKQWSNKDYVLKAGSTPLHIAVDLCKDHYVTFMLQHGANPNVANSDGVTSYNIALKRQHNRIFYELLKSDPEFYRKKKYEKLGLTKLQIACFTRDIYMVKKELESGIDVNERISFDSQVWPGDAAFHLLYRGCYPRGSHEIVKLLLAHGADPSLPNASGSTPVHLSEGEIFKIPTFSPGNDFFLKNSVNSQGQSHFHVSCMIDNLSAAENFIKTGINVNATVDYFADCYAGYTPLHYAVRNKNLNLIELLLNSGADPNIKAANGYTSLHMAVAEENINSLHLLFRCSNLDIQATNLLGDTALEMAIYVNYTFNPTIILPELLNKGISINFARLINFRSNNKLISIVAGKLPFEIFQQFIANVQDLTISDDNHQNIIHHLSLDDINDYYMDKYKIPIALKNIELLINSGCEIDHKNKDGKTALHLATSLKHKLMINILLALGADINVKDDDKKVPYAYASDPYCKVKFMDHILKLKAMGQHVDEFNNVNLCDINLLNYSSDEEDIFWRVEDDFDLSDVVHLIEIEDFDFKLKKNINPSFSTAYVLSEQFLKDYRRIPELQRRDIYDLCMPYQRLFSFIKIQFRRARTRNRLLVPAVNSLQVLTNIAIPELCFEIINYLDTDNLMNLVRAVNDKLEFSPLNEIL